MKDRLLQVRVDDGFVSKLEYLQDINGFKSVAETVRKVVEKEYRKERCTEREKEDASKCPYCGCNKINKD